MVHKTNFWKPTSLATWYLGIILMADTRQEHFSPLEQQLRLQSRKGSKTVCKWLAFQAVSLSCSARANIMAVSSLDCISASSSDTPAKDVPAKCWKLNLMNAKDAKTWYHFKLMYWADSGMYVNRVDQNLSTGMVPDWTGICASNVPKAACCHLKKPSTRSFFTSFLKCARTFLVTTILGRAQYLFWPSLKIRLRKTAAWRTGWDHHRKIRRASVLNSFLHR